MWFVGSTGDPPVPSGNSPDRTGATVRANGQGLFVARAMEVSANIQCPVCGQRFELVIDTSIASQRFTTDCEVCCRPFEVIAECEPGEISSLMAEGGAS